MKTEIEAKWLNIDHDAMRNKLKEAGAKLAAPERLMRRKNFDFPDKRLYNNRMGWVRIRDEGNKLTMSYKQVDDRNIDGTKEVNITIDDFDSASDFLEEIGMKAKSYQETKRESWVFDGNEIELDTWPWIPSFIEIESPNEDELKRIAGLLGLNWEEALHGSVEVAYQAVFDVSEEEIDHWDTIVFGEVPPNIEATRK